MTYLQRRFARSIAIGILSIFETRDAVCLCGKVRGSKRAAKGKYNARRCFYNGVYYDSTFEATYAMQLDWRKEAKDIRDWDLQYSVRIEIEGEHILTTRVDFRVHENDGSPRRNQRIRNAGLQDQEKAHRGSVAQKPLGIFLRRREVTGQCLTVDDEQRNRLPKTSVPLLPE